MDSTLLTNMEDQLFAQFCRLFPINEFEMFCQLFPLIEDWEDDEASVADWLDELKTTADPQPTHIN